MSRSRRTPRCAGEVPPEKLSENDRREIEKFKQYLLVEKARREGADPSTCDMLEGAIYPEHTLTSKGDA